MKKFILFFFAMVLSTVTGFAKDVVFDVTVNPGEIYYDESGSKAAGDQSITLDGVTIASPACLWDQQYRIYKGADLTVTSTVGPIAKIEFTCTANDDVKYGPGCFAALEGYTFEGKVGTWVGEAEQVVFHAESNQVRATQIVVTLAEPADPVVFSDVVDGGVYAIVNVQPLNPVKFYVLESVDGELTTQSADDLKGSTKYAETAQFKAIELEDGRFAFQNVANGEYLAWRNHNGQGGNGNCGFNPEINELSSWTMNDGTVFADYRTYWFYVNKRSESNNSAGTLIVGNDGNWNGWGATECTGRTDFSNDYGFVACASEVDFTKVNIASVAEEASESIDADKWYLVKQRRGGVSPIYDNGGNVYRAKSDNVVAAGVDAADVVDYLVHFVPAGEEDVYNIQFANGRYFADGSEASNSTPVTTTEEEPGLFNVKYILDTPGHFGIYAYDMGAVIDNNGLGNTVVYWGNGEISDKVDGNNDFKIYEVEFAAKTTAAADLKDLIKEVEAAYALNNVAEVGEGIITSTDQFSSPYTCGQNMEPGSGVQNLLDMDGKTYWHSDWSSAVDSHYHYLQVEFTEPISGDFEFNMNRRVNGSSLCANDNPVKMSVEISLDGEEFVLADEFETPFTQTAAAPLVQAAINIPTAAKYLRFFNDESNGTNQRGYWHCGDLQLKPIITPALNVSNAEAAAALLEAVAAAKACGANATDADVAALQAAFAAYEAALAGTPEPSACVATITAVFPNGNKHVVYSNGSKLTASAEAPADAIVKFEVVSREDNTIVLKAGDQYIHWTSGDNTGKSADLDGLNADLDESLNTLTMAPATLQGAYTSSEWGKTEADVAGLYRLMGHGTDGGLYDFTLRENDDAWIAGDAGMFFFDTNWDGNGCRTSFFEIEITEGGVEPAPVPVTFEFTDNEDGTITVTPSDLEAPYFFNIYSDRINTEYQLGTDAEAIAADVAQNLTAPETEVHTGVSVVNPAEWINYWFGGYVQYTAGDYRLGVVALNWDGTYTMAGEPVFHAFTKAASEPVVDEKYALNFDKALEQKSNDRHVTGFSLNDQTVEFPAYTTVYLDATDQVIEVNAGEELQPAIIWDGAWMHGIVYVDLDNDGSFYEEGDLVAHSPYTGNQNLATSISAFTAPEKAGEYRMRIKTDWVGDSQNMDGGGLDPAGRIGDDGTMEGNNSIWANRGRIIDLVLKVVADEPETFPMEGVAYKFKNVDSQLYVKVIDDPDQNVTLGTTPDEMFFTAVEGGWTLSNSKGYVLGATAKGWNIGNSSNPIVWTIEEVEGGYAFHNEKGYLGFDTAAAGQKAFRDKNYTTHHGIFNIWKYDEEEIIVVPDATLEETWENIHNLLAEAEAIKALNQVELTYDADGYFEDFISPIVGKVGYKKHDDVWAVCDGADYVNDFVSYFNTAEEAEEYLSEFGGIAALEEIIKNVVDDYNAAEVVLPTPGKTYVIRNHANTYGDEFSYAYYFNGEKLALSECANATTAEYMWTASEPVKYSYFDADLNVIEETRYQFVNAADETQFMAWRGAGGDAYNGVTTDANQANSKWFITGKKVDGSAAPVYGTLALRTNADGNQYRTAVVDMRKSTDHLSKSNGDHFDATYSSWFIFEEVEVPVTVWNGEKPVVEVADDTTVKVTFTDANKVESSNFGVLAAVYDESGDVYGLVFDDLFGDTVEYGKDCATLHFKKISEINAELAGAAKAAASKIGGAVNGGVAGKVVICSKSFKIDDSTLYDEVIVADFSISGNEPTGIEAVANDSLVKVYDIQGRRVAAPRKGLYIQNGQKVIK